MRALLEVQLSTAGRTLQESFEVLSESRISFGCCSSDFHYGTDQTKEAFHWDTHRACVTSCSIPGLEAMGQSRLQRTLSCFEPDGIWSVELGYFAHILTLTHELDRPCDSASKLDWTFRLCVEHVGVPFGFVALVGNECEYLGGWSVDVDRVA